MNRALNSSNRSACCTPIPLPMQHADTADFQTHVINSRRLDNYHSQSDGYARTHTHTFASKTYRTNRRHVPTDFRYRRVCTPSFTRTTLQRVSQYIETDHLRRTRQCFRKSFSTTSVLLRHFHYCTYLLYSMCERRYSAPYSRYSLGIHITHKNIIRMAFP